MLKIYLAHAYLLGGGGVFEDKLFLILVKFGGREVVELLIFLLNSPKAIYISFMIKYNFIHYNDISYLIYKRHIAEYFS